MEDGPRIIGPERACILDLGAQAGIPGEGPACGASAQLQEELARAVVVAVVEAGEEERERVAERIADPVLVGDRDVAGTEDDRGSGPLEREVEPASPRAALRAVRNVTVDAGLEAGNVRRQVRGAPAQREAADPVVGRHTEAAHAIELDGAAPRGGLDPQHVLRADHPVGRLGPVDPEALDDGVLRAVQAAADVDCVANDPRGRPQIDLAVHRDQIARDDALDDQRRAQDEDRARHGVRSPKRRVPRDEQVAAGEHLIEPLVHARRAGADALYPLRCRGRRRDGGSQQHEERSRDRGKGSHVTGSSRKLARMARPPSLAIDSGWNWTPHTGSVRCRRARISSSQPASSVQAVTSSSGGSVAGSMMSE